MKSVSLKTYTRNYIRALSGSLAIKKLAVIADTTNHRLYVPLSVYAYLTRSPSSWFSGRCRELLDGLYKADIARTDEEVIGYLLRSNDEESVKFVSTFNAENKRRDQTELKNRYREAFLKLKADYCITDHDLGEFVECTVPTIRRFLFGSDNSSLSVKRLDAALTKMKKFYRF